MATRIGVDIGGTFTDLIFYDDQSGEIRLAKERTTPAALQDGVITAVRNVLASSHIEATEYFLHGTTVGLNALLTRTGATVGLLTTKGFRDVLEIRRGDRESPYDLFWGPDTSLVPRRLRRPVTERLLADGSVHTPFEPEDVAGAVGVFNEAGVTSIAVVFLHSYVNPAHELEAEQALRAAGFEGHVSLSHRISGEYREYERTCTTVVDAYVRPRTATYLSQLESRLRDVGFSGRLLITRSGGGVISFEEASTRPFETIIAGPVAGAEGAAEIARRLKLDNVITADVGGTSFDTCIITDGKPRLLYEGRVLGLPLQAPWVDVRSIGAGGGSIAYIDAGGLLRVGPESAGADPGPACYGQGTKPTVTDAALVLGMLGEGVLASGLVLEPQRARDAIAPLAAALELEPDDVARGIITIAAASMANEIREMAMEQGQDPRTAALLAFGGAGPLFATLLSRELELHEIVIPPHAGNFSAWGLLGADVAQTAARTMIMRLQEDTLDRANEVLAKLFNELATRTAAASNGSGATERRVAADMRYKGQEHTITVDVPATPSGLAAASVDDVRRAFIDDYARTFGHSMDDEIEIVALRATVRTPLPRRAEEQPPSTNGSQRPSDSELDAYSFALRKWTPFRLIHRRELLPGIAFEGPAILAEETTTTYLDSGFSAVLDESGSLLVTAPEGMR